MSTFNVRRAVFQFLRILVRGKAADSNGNTKQLQFSCDYAWLPGVPGNNPATGAKATLVTTAVSGFKAVVVAPLLACLNARWVSIGIFTRWLDQLTDPFQLAGLAFVTPGGVGAAASSLPLDNAVVVRKNTGLRGRQFRGSWHFCPIDTSMVLTDELTAGGQTVFRALANGLNTVITDGVATMTPVLISTTGSQLERDPIRIAGATFAGTSATAGVAPSILLPVNSTLGTVKKRKEKPPVTF